ncbi:hypothetical protein D7316_00640 [Gordonia insulae]|uniref:Uncharacterized protein n=1 Tax=Gordonia insulae TaxID=2420509 RepID=A0A3G8JIL2_9ACTN|nr:hypothetical protein D7316_00640 [Gordonia insulae]
MAPNLMAPNLMALNLTTEKPDRGDRSQDRAPE